MVNLVELPCRDGAGNVRVVIESPRGATVKLKYDPKSGVFELQRFLAENRYPCDWGFVPSTLAEDGDPLDATVIHDGETFPGVVIPSIPIGLLRVTQASNGQAEPVRNDRLIAVPAARPKPSTIDEMGSPLREELARFFATTAELAGKRVSVDGWSGRAEAEQAIIVAGEAFANAKR